MSSTLLDVTRSAHEEVERLERLIVKDLQKDPATNKDRLYQNHRVHNMVDAIMSTTQRLIEIYEDKDHARKDEIAALGGQGASGQNVFGAFYDRLKEIREYHRRHPTAQIVDMLDDPEELLKEEPRIDFSGEWYPRDPSHRPTGLTLVLLIVKLGFKKERSKARLIH